MKRPQETKLCNKENITICGQRFWEYQASKITGLKQSKTKFKHNRRRKL